MVIYYTTRDKPVLGEIVKMGLCQMLTKGHSMYNGKTRKTPPVACQWNTRLKPTLQTPIFFGFTPLLTFFGEWCIIIFAVILYWYLDGVMM